MTSRNDKTKAERQAAEKAALARAKRWSEEQRRSRSPGATTVRASESSSKEVRVQSNATSPDATTPDIQYRKTPSTSERTQARARARGRSTELKKTTRNPKADVPATVETERAKAHAIDTEELSVNAENFKAYTTEHVHEDRPACTGDVVHKAHTKEMLSITNDLIKITEEIRSSLRCDGEYQS